MPDPFLQTLCARAGFYRGTGINHEGQTFTGSLVIRPAFGGAALWFRAEGAGAELFHEEIVLIGGTFTGGLTMTSLNTNVPAAQHFVSETADAGGASFVTPDFDKPNMFRERVTLGFTKDGITYAFAWGMPGQPVEDRSSALLRPAAGHPPECLLA